MEKQKKWQSFLIAAIIFLTVYNILPTVFFYAKPLKSPIDEKRATAISASIAQRVNALEQDAEEWLDSFCDLIKVKPLSIAFQPKDPLFLTITFKSLEDAQLFRTHFPRAGSLIPFAPSQLSLYDPHDTASKSVVVQRRIPLHFDGNRLSEYYQFSMKTDATGDPAPLYRALVEDRAMQLGIALAGTSENAQWVQAATAANAVAQTQDLLISLAQNILSFTKTFGEHSSITQRYFASFTQIEGVDRPAFVQNFIQALSHLKDKIKTERSSLQEEGDRLRGQGQFLDADKQQRLELLSGKEKTLDNALTIVRRNAAYFSQGKNPLNYATLASLLQQSASQGKTQTIALQGYNAFVDQLIIDWSSEQIHIGLYPDVASLRASAEKDTSLAAMRDGIDQSLYNEIAFASRHSGETIAPFQERFVVHLNHLTHSKSFLAMRLGAIASAQVQQCKEIIQKTWNPQHPDLKSDQFPILDYETFEALPRDQQKLALVIYAPAIYKKIPPAGMHMNTIYVIAKGMDKIIDRIYNEPNSPQANQFIQDFNRLRDILQLNGFVGYSGTSYGLSPEFAQDFIFEGEDYYNSVLKATREDFTVRGTKRYAVLEFTDVQQRVLTENRIGNRLHEDLLKSRDDYSAAQLNIKGVSSYDVPKPIRNVYWDNFKLSFVKYFRGDDRKILHWGLDLSGGKTVQIELRDANNRIVTNEADLKQGVNELYNRVNKMGVSEVSIRHEGNYITLDFPGSQGLSASELVKASSMQFHVVNEKFGPLNPTLSDASNKFLQDVWNEALVTNRKQIDEINQIAWKYLHGDSTDPEVIQPRTPAARTLYEQNLKLVNPWETSLSNAFNETYSLIAQYRGDDFTEWHGQTHPLLFVFKNRALEGSDLDNVQSAYEPSKGNYLSFTVKGSYTNKEGQKMSPRDGLFAWTSHFAKETIAGTPLETLSSGRGWRMAVILNGSIISAPTLDSPLRDSAMISGSFTQREINQLEADLKAGSLSFTPRIVSEMNVSPELGTKERVCGIVATALSLCLVIAAMLFYYRFGGLVASVAVVFNLLILWATLQNLQATMTLAGIAAIILTLGMAVDANVLVFERIREEFASSGRIASAVHTGYRKAFSAIVDSNVTTIIAALVLLHFDSGPIKGFALTLIIGIVSSMITALFITRYFFAGWVQNPQNKQLHMLNWFRAKKFDFLKYTRLTLILSCLIIIGGGALLLTQRATIFGMDFKGGYALNVDLPAQNAVNYRQKVEESLLSQGADARDFQIRELSPSNRLRIFLSRNLKQPGHPFFGMPLTNDLKEPAYPYENNPKIVWVVQALQKNNITLDPQALAGLDKTWTEVSGQMSDSMRNSAIVGLAIALFAILAYITFRFEFKYAVSATLCIVHDVLFTLGFIALLHALKIPLQIDLNTVAALLTIVGYSLNDTIIVFDRIREDVRLMRKASFSEIINHALNITLSRTTMTSGTTLLVLIPLILLGGSTLFGFALVMAIGVIFGTLSSLFIATPLLKFFHDREEMKFDLLRN
ncbi:MAG TPA: protein translocase subunit SecD [Rhabdochlamydiaceae bacterium]|jgi:SecD/SecF fusion protein